MEGRALFIIHDVYQEDNHFPLGVAYMAAVLKKQGVDVWICSQDVFHYTNRELTESFLKNDKYDLIGVGFLAPRFKETVIDLCAIINEYKKDAWLVLGGHGPSPIPEYMFEKAGADIVAIGEAEETILELLNCKLNNGDLAKVEGIAYCDRKNKKIIVNNRRQPVRNLDSIPFPEWSLFPMEEYTSCLKSWW